MSDERDSRFAAETLFSQLQSLLKEIPGVRQAEDLEYLHRMRVASRRLRNSITLLEKYLPAKPLAAWTKQIRRVTKTLGAARDLDVQIAVLQDIYAKAPEKRDRPGIARLLLRLQQTRARQQRKVLTILDELKRDHTISTMEDTLRLLRTSSDLEDHEAVSPELLRYAESATVARLRDMLSYEGYIEDPSQIEKLHAMRIAAKHLRYSLQTFTPIFTEKPQEILSTVRNIQDLLGEIHDADVWIAMLPEFEKKECKRMLKYAGSTHEFARLKVGLDYLAENRQQFREQRYQEFLAFWQETKEQDVWKKLRQFLQEQTG